MADLRYRALQREEYPAFQRFNDYAFHVESGPRTYETPGEVPDRLGERWGLFDGDRLVSICAHYDFEARLRGEWRPIGGLASVATPPEFRRNGYVRRLCLGFLRECRKRGQHVAALWPFRRSFYRRLGWGTCSRYGVASTSPEALADAAGDAGTLHRVDPDDWAMLDDLYERTSEDVQLRLRRDETWWRQRVFEGLDDQRYVARLDRDGETVGSLAYAVSKDGDERTLRVHDLLAVDETAYRGLLRYLAVHESQVQQVKLYDRADRATDLLDRVADTDALSVEVAAGAMARLVDVPAGLSALAATGTDASLTLSVSDSLADWNDGTLELRVADGEATCEPVDTEQPDVRTDVATLSQVAVGYHSPDDAARLGEFEADAEARESLRALFPPATTGLRDFF